MSHPIPGHDYSDKTSDESKKDHSNRRKVAINKALSGSKDPKRMMANEKGKYLFNKVMDGDKKAKRIAKLVENAPEGSALRPWSYDKRKYL